MAMLTLNTDGCSKGNPRVCGGDGILQNSSWQPLVGFSAFFEETFSLRAKTLTLLAGLQICTQNYEH